MSEKVYSVIFRGLKIEVPEKHVPRIVGEHVERKWAEFYSAHKRAGKRVDTPGFCKWYLERLEKPEARPLTLEAMAERFLGRKPTAQEIKTLAAMLAARPEPEK